MLEAEQMMLPIEIHPVETVSWMNVVRVMNNRRLLGRKAMSYTFLLNTKTGLPDTTKIAVDQINDLKDPDLRYALRFSATAEAVGWIKESPYSSYSHHVSVEATDEGIHSRLMKATYTGRVENGVDTFMQTLQLFEPQPEVQGMTAVLVRGVESTPGTVFWVKRGTAE